MEWNIKNINYITLAKGVTILCALCVVATALYVGMFVPDFVEPDNYAKTCYSTSDGSSKCDKTEIWLVSYVREALDNKYEEIVEKERQERQLFFRTHLRDTKPSSAYDGTRFSMKPSAKLMGKKLTKKNDSQGMTPIDIWYDGIELERRGGFTRHHARSYNGRLVVPVNGTYKVYSFVEFYEPCFYPSGIPNVEDKKSPIKHAIYRYIVTDNNNIEVVSSAQPHKINKDNFENVYSSYISTVLVLYAGDELSVQVSNITLLEYTKDNYFGLILI